MFAFCYIGTGNNRAPTKIFSTGMDTVLPHCYSDVSKNNMLHIGVLWCTATSLSKPVHHTKNVNIISAIALIDRLLYSYIKSNINFFGTFYA